MQIAILHSAAYLSQLPGPGVKCELWSQMGSCCFTPFLAFPSREILKTTNRGYKISSTGWAFVESLESPTVLGKWIPFGLWITPPSHSHPQSPPSELPAVLQNPWTPSRKAALCCPLLDIICHYNPSGTALLHTHYTSFFILPSTPGQEKRLLKLTELS